MTRGPKLYFAYDATIDPARLADVAPGAEFQFIAHLPEWRLTFPIPNGDGSLPSVHPESGNTVWGAVFSLPSSDLDGLNQAHEQEGRVPTTTQAMDREGRRHDVLVHVAGNGAAAEGRPEQGYLARMVGGGRHWRLPAGWIASLEEHLEGL
ncbi:MAG: gamma-glutamylcyclotransferase [Actinobacteria bacterium]|nr:gamma-glutamylcyclotransferase [Actinomycetota bacterium]